MKKEEIKEEEKKTKKLDLLINNYKGNPAFKALIKLSLYFLLFFIIILVVSLGGGTTETENNTEKKEETTTNTSTQIKSYKDMLNHILINNNSFKYEININDDRFIIEYTIEDNILNGIMETNEGAKKFSIKDNTIYEIKLNEEYENNELFSDINLDYLNIYSLINILSSSKAMKLLNDDKVLYNYTIDNTLVTVTVQDEKISNIEINQDNNTYLISIL